MIERALSPTVIAMFRLIGPLADRQPELSKIFFEQGPGRTQHVIGAYLRTNFADILWTEDYETAGRDLFALSGAEVHFARMWGIGGVLTAREKDARARHAAKLFLRAYAHDPDKLVPRDASNAEK